MSWLLPYPQATLLLECRHIPDKQSHSCPFWAEIPPRHKYAISCQQASSTENASLIPPPLQGYEVDKFNFCVIYLKICVQKFISTLLVSW